MAAEELMNTLRITPAPLGLDHFLKDEEGKLKTTSQENGRVGEKWQSAFEEQCNALGQDTLLI